MPATYRFPHAFPFVTEATLLGSQGDIAQAEAINGFFNDFVGVSQSLTSDCLTETMADGTVYRVKALVSDVLTETLADGTVRAVLGLQSLTLTETLADGQVTTTVALRGSIVTETLADGQVTATLGLHSGAMTETLATGRVLSVQGLSSSALTEQLSTARITILINPAHLPSCVTAVNDELCVGIENDELSVTIIPLCRLYADREMQGRLSGPCSRTARTYPPGWTTYCPLTSSGTCPTGHNRHARARSTPTRPKSPTN